MVTQNNFILPFLAVSSEECKHALEKSNLFYRERLNLLVTYIFNLAEYDLNYDILKVTHD